ncbi:PQQ-binding-like beta-propeller repeat protein [Micromonospora echinospora]|uniref:outer membrane protein assembly factor BamB family protein n=1 Tax=Micromonospora echinospora TaxID=1877 RepID=UPI0033CCE530
MLYSSSFGDEDDDVPPLAVATDVTTGRQKWRIEGAGKYIGALRSDGDVTFGYSAVESRHTTLLAWDAHTGRQRWSLPLLVDVDPLHLGGGLLYLFTADGRGQAGYLYVVDVAAGTVKWRARAARAELFSALSVVFADQTVFFAGDAVYAFDVATGARRWRTESLDIRYASHLLLNSGKLLVTVAPNAKDYPTKLYALDADGRGRLGASDHRRVQRAGPGRRGPARSRPQRGRHLGLRSLTTTSALDGCVPARLNR